MKLNKPYTNKQYAELAVYCNQNNCHIEDKDTFLQAIANTPTDESTYAQKRAAEYPPMTDYLDAMVKINSDNSELIDAGQKQLADYVAACLTVKAKYPKNK